MNVQLFIYCEVYQCLWQLICYSYSVSSRDGHKTSVAETETRPRWDRDKMFKFWHETDMRRSQVSRCGRDVEMHVVINAVVNKLM